jgi:hypothetical protein
MRVKGTNVLQANVSPKNYATVVSQHPVERLVARFLFFSISDGMILFRVSCPLIFFTLNEEPCGRDRRVS